MLASKGSDIEWSPVRTKATLFAGFLLLLPSTTVLAAFRDPAARIATEEKLEGVRGHRLVPHFLVSSIFFAWMGAGLIVKFLPLFFIHTHGLSSEGLSLLQCISAFAVALLTKILGDSARYCGRAWMSAFCLAGVAFCLILMSKIESLWLLCSLFVLRASFAAANFALLGSILMNHTPSSQRGRWNSLLSVLNMS